LWLTIFSENQLYSFLALFFCVDRYNEFRLMEIFSDNLNGKKQATLLTKLRTSSISTFNTKNEVNESTFD